MFSQRYLGGNAFLRAGLVNLTAGACDLAVQNNFRRSDLDFFRILCFSYVRTYDVQAIVA